MTAGEGTTAAAVPAAAGRRARLAWLLLGVVILAGGALRFWYLPAADRLSTEGLGIGNIESMLVGGEKPRYDVTMLSWYPQLLAVGMADRFFDGAAGGKFHVLTEKGRVTRRGLAVARSLSVIYGLACIVLIYPIARRLHSTAVALIAALILCFTPWHIQGSVGFTPDILVLFLSMLALWLGLRALDQPSPARFALVGVALGAAAAANVSGALIALPVLLGLVAGGRRELPRILLPIAVTVPLALLVWWVLTPPLGLYAEALELDQASQIRRAPREASTRFTVAVFGFLYPLRDAVHGPLLGTLALLGALGQVFRCLFLVDAGPDRVHRIMVLAAAPVFIVGYALGTPLFRSSGFLPLLAFSALYAAVMLEILWHGLVGLVPKLASPRRATVTAVLATLLTVALVAPRGWNFVHSRAVSSTVDAALDWLRADYSPVEGPRLVVVEEAALVAVSESAIELAKGIGLRVVPRLAAVDEERLATSDGEVFLHLELEGEEGAFYRSRGRAPARRKVIAGNALWQRGPDLVAVRRSPGVSAASRVPLPVERRDKMRFATVPGAAAGLRSFSLVLELPPTAETAPVPPRARIDGVEIDFLPAGRHDGKPVFFSERLPTTVADRSLGIQPPPWMSARQGKLTAAMFLWRHERDSDSNKP